MNQVSESLAFQSLLQAKQEDHDNTENLSARAWEIYLKITRHAPGCTQNMFYSWLKDQTVT